MAAALARLQEADPQLKAFEFSLPGAKNKTADGRDPDEIIMICLDVSRSMDIRLKSGFNQPRGGRNNAELTRVTSLSLGCLI